MGIDFLRQSSHYVFSSYETKGHEMKLLDRTDKILLAIAAVGLILAWL